MVFAGYVLALPFFSLILSAWGGIWLLVISFRESTTQGLLCLIPCYQLYYVFSRWDDTRGAFCLSFGSQIPVVGLAVLMPVLLTGAGQLDGNAQRPNVAVQQVPDFNNAPLPAEEPPPPMVMPPGPLPAPGPFRGGPPPGTGRIPFAAPFRGGPPPGTGRIPFPGRPAFPRIQTPDQQLKRIVEGHGDRAVAIVVLGLPRNSDPDKGVTARDVSQAINKQLRELAPGATEFLSIGGTDRTKIFMAPIDDKQGLAKRIGFGKVVVVKADLFEVTVSPDFIASVPRLPAEQQVAVPDIGPSTREPEPKIPDGADAVTKSLIQLKSHDKGKQKEAIQRLERTAPDERDDEVVAALLPLLEDDDGFLVNDVIKALTVWQTPEVVPALIQRTKDNRFFVRHEAIKALGKSKDVRAVEPLIERFKEDGFQSEDALKALGSVAEPALIARLKDGDAEIRRKACNILKVVGGRDTLKAMDAMPQDPDFGTRVAASAAYKEIGLRVGPLPGSKKASKAGTGTRGKR